MKNIILRDYQEQAINNLKHNNWEGLFEMATGTGKTFTGLFATIEYKNIYGKICRVILVPFIHLIDQWKNECLGLDITNIVECSSNNKDWEFKLNGKIRDYNINLLDDLTIITTYNTSQVDRFKSLISRIKDNLFLIADECHYFGTSNIDTSIYNYASGKLGLSATPMRWWDDSGTQKIYSFFKKTVYEYDLKSAIKNDYLTPYRYNPIIIDLLNEEKIEYKSLSRSIMIMIDNNETDTNKFLMTTLKRKKVIDNAYYKNIVLKKIFRDKKNIKMDNTLVYCSSDNLDEITKYIGSLDIKVRKFNYSISKKDRTKILSEFAKGEIQVLTAIKCLDEGVDIPSVKDAYLLSSTSNPREFVQRRGRILRKHKNKSIANIYDFIVLPNTSDYNLIKSLAKSELPRFAEFSENAINNISCRREVKSILSRHRLEHLMDKLPWEVYNENNL